ncbi:MAG: VanZ family protein [Bacilli bacterium]|nr:VanZ family protein [Bacilli bacterium]MDD4282611.1 VanZ family protein [Bacilli bacterium]MDD4718519.1 VanZ family protein [Bacilli bacterium]
MEKEAIINLFTEVWPMMLIFCVVIVSLRVVYIFKNNQKFVIYKELLYLAFLLYIMLLFHVVTFQDVVWSSSNFTPFKEMFRYTFGSKGFYKNVVGNMIMFMPYGFFVSYFIKLKKPYIVLVLSLIVSITIETTQMIIGRVFDIDDIFLNILGAFIGYFVYRVFAKAVDKLPALLKKDHIYNIIIILIIIFLLTTFVIL